MRAPWLLMLPAAAACGLEFSEPVVDTPAALRVYLTLTDSAPVGSAQVSGFLWPGYGADGAVRIPSDSSVRVMGRTIVPYMGLTTDAPSDIAYAESWGFDPAAPLGRVELEAPAIPGVAAPVLRVTPPWPLGPSDVTVSVDSTLRLDLATETAPADTVFEHWEVYVLREDGWPVARLLATGPVPSSVEVPWGMLSGLATGGQVVLRVSQSVIASRGGHYDVVFGVTTSHTWFVTVTP